MVPEQHKLCGDKDRGSPHWRAGYHHQDPGKHRHSSTPTTSDISSAPKGCFQRNTTKIGRTLSSWQEFLGICSTRQKSTCRTESSNESGCDTYLGGHAMKGKGNAIKEVKTKFLDEKRGLPGLFTTIFTRRGIQN